MDAVRIIERRTATGERVFCLETPDGEIPLSDWEMYHLMGGALENRKRKGAWLTDDNGEKRPGTLERRRLARERSKRRNSQPPAIHRWIREGCDPL